MKRQIYWKYPSLKKFLHKYSRRGDKYFPHSATNIVESCVSLGAGSRPGLCPQMAPVRSWNKQGKSVIGGWADILPSSMGFKTFFFNRTRIKNRGNTEIKFDRGGSTFQPKKLAESAVNASMVNDMVWDSAQCSVFRFSVWSCSQFMIVFVDFYSHNLFSLHLFW